VWKQVWNELPAVKYPCPVRCIRRRPRKQQPEGEDDGGEEPEGHANAAEERQGKSRVPAQSALTAAVSLSAPLVLKQHLKMKFDRSFI
jgi:hypothetical protein